MSDKQRERFEAHCRKKGGLPTISCGVTGRYYSDLTELAWQTWQAAAPAELTAETGHKYAMIGEFSEAIEVECTDANSEESEFFRQEVLISWDNIKRIYDRALEVHHGKNL